MSHHHIPHSQSAKERPEVHGNERIKSSIVEIQDNIIIKELQNRIYIVLIIFQYWAYIFDINLVFVCKKCCNKHECDVRRQHSY